MSRFDTTRNWSQKIILSATKSHFHINTPNKYQFDPNDSWFCQAETKSSGIILLLCFSRTLAYFEGLLLCVFLPSSSFLISAIQLDVQGRISSGWHEHSINRLKKISVNCTLNRLSVSYLQAHCLMQRVYHR